MLRITHGFVYGIDLMRFNLRNYSFVSVHSVSHKNTLKDTSGQKVKHDSPNYY